LYPCMAETKFFLRLPSESSTSTDSNVGVTIDFSSNLDMWDSFSEKYKENKFWRFNETSHVATYIWEAGK
jgi:hypothetical protein